jgi:hypothetical protein
MCRAQHLGCFNTLNFVCDITLTLQDVYLPVSKTYLGSIIRFNRFLFTLNQISCAIIVYLWIEFFLASIQLVDGSTEGSANIKAIK